MSRTHCNINARGKAVRLLWGGLCLLVAIALVAIILFDVVSGWGWWVGVGVTAFFGALGIYEGRKGWCFVRAMGMKTPV